MNVWIIYTSYCDWQPNQTQIHRLNCTSRHASCFKNIQNTYSTRKRNAKFTHFEHFVCNLNRFRLSPQNVQTWPFFFDFRKAGSGVNSLISESHGTMFVQSSYDVRTMAKKFIQHCTNFSGRLYEHCTNFSGHCTNIVRTLYELCFVRALAQLLCQSWMEHTSAIYQHYSTKNIKLTIPKLYHIFINRICKCPILFLVPFARDGKTEPFGLF